MTASELTARVTVSTALAVLPLALAAFWLGGASGALGAAAGGALALGSFRLLAARATAPSATTAWVVLSALRFAAVAAVAAVLFASGWAHPLAMLVGYSALPVAVVVHGLRLARENASWT
jgi:ATP synthase I chain